MQGSKVCICKCMLVYAYTANGSKALNWDFNFTKENDKVFLFLCDIFCVFAGNIHPQCKKRAMMLLDSSPCLI